MSEHIRVYADYTGAGVSSPELREAAANLVLSQPLYGNPHSAHALGLQSAADVTTARGSMLTYFDAWEEYEVIFTSGATHALRVAQEIFASLPIRDKELIPNSNNIVHHETSSSSNSSSTVVVDEAAAQSEENTTSSNNNNNSCALPNNNNNNNNNNKTTTTNNNNNNNNDDDNDNDNNNNNNIYF